MALPHWVIKIIMKLFPKRFFLAKFTHIPIIREITEAMLFKDDEIYYLPQDTIIADKKNRSKKIVINKAIDQTIDLVIPSQVLEHFVDKAKYRWLMNFCLCRTANECKSYSQDLGCIFLGEAVLDINPAYGKLVSKEEAKEHLAKCQSEGLVHLIGRNKIDSQWLQVGPGTKLMTICNCCECCCLWKMIPNVDAKISRNLSRMPGVSIQVNDSCISCGDCLNDICFVNAIAIVGDKAQINQEFCLGCGRCVSICTNNAITLKIDNQYFVEETIDNLTKMVDVT